MNRIFPMRRFTSVAAYAALFTAARAGCLPAQPSRTLRPDDLFAIEQVASAAWSPEDGAVAVLFRRSERWLDWSVPTSDLRVLDVATAQWRTVAARNARYLGYFAPAWSPNGRTLAFLSVDSSGVVRPLLWTRGATAARLVRGIQLSDGLADAPVAIWRDDAHVIFLARDTTIANSGPIYARVTTYRNAADRWRAAHDGRVASLTVMESGAKGSVAAHRRLVAVDTRTGAIAELASGDIRHPEISDDRATLTWWTQRVSLRSTIDTALLGTSAAAADYLRADWGDEQRALDLRNGRATELPRHTASPVPAPVPLAPRGDARRVAAAGDGSAALYVASSDTDGTRLWLARRDGAPREVWHGNAWVRDLRSGPTERIAYTDAGGRTLNGWVLYPPGHHTRERLPAVVSVYPDVALTDRVPVEFSLLYREFDAPQLFAALGYVVILPSIPYPEKPLQSDMIGPLLAGVLPLVDSVVAHGIADPARIAVHGQSAGGYSTQAMITRTDRFRTAIPSAGYSDLISFYGGFYGQYRHGDAGDPQVAGLLRMMQFERGSLRAGAPPWTVPEQYIANSPLFAAQNVHTPILIVQGEDDFVPVQQSEEFFTALYRQGRRAEFVRYYGEEHTIAGRANVLDLWSRIEAWLRDTMAPR